MTDLSLLSAKEREVLALLADGHTAKSIATIKDLSVGAVNERLRAARRKAGVGSSRELARALRLQESRDEEMGLPGVVTETEAPRAPTKRHVGRRILMPLTTMIALAVAAATLQQSQSSTVADATAASQPDRLLGGLDDPRTTVAAVHRRLEDEARDEPWASRTEATLRARYSRLPHMGESGLGMRVTCATTICEVAASLPKTTKNEQAAKLIEELQAEPLSDDLAAIGLRNEAHGFGGGSFASYWRRVTSR